MKRFIPIVLITILAAATVLAQDDTTPGDTTTTTDAPQTSVDIFFVACETEGVMNLSGFATPGFDIFYQLFGGANGTGDSLTSLRRANVDGDYAFSERIGYRDGRSVPASSIASARVIIARTETPENPTFETFVDDIQDGCNDAQNPLQSSDDAGDPVQEDEGLLEDGEILSPFGGLLNPNVEITPEPLVVLGPRIEFNPNRRPNPGVIFAECDSYRPDAAPGLLYDTDNITIFWSWFADSAERVQENLSNTIYQVKLNQAPLADVQASSITERDGLFYVFYTANIGNLRPGFYEVEFKQDWSAPINDGFDEYGPGTANPQVRSLCNFKVELNPTRAQVSYSTLYFPADTPAHNFERGIVRQQVIEQFREDANNSNVGVREEE